MAESSTPFQQSPLTPVTIFQDAADLLERGAGYRFDVQRRKDNWRIYYAVDADVLVTYVSPSRNPRHGALFCADETLATLVVRMIGDFMLRKLVSGNGVNGAKGHLLIISPHDEEIHRYLFRLQGDLRKLLHLPPGKAESILRWIHSHDTHQQVAATLIEHAAEFMEAIGGVDGAVQDIERYRELNPSRVINLLRYEERRADGTIFRFPRPPTDARDESFSVFSQRYGDWKTALVDLNTGKSKEAVRADALVLTTLEWVNEHMAEERARLVLVTGSQTIFKAAASLFPRSGAPFGASFEGRYLRHPRALLADDDFFAVPSAEASTPLARFQVLDWLNAFLPKYVAPQVWGALRTGDISAELPTAAQWAEIIRTAPETERRNLDRDVPELVTKWADQVRHVAVKRGLEFGLDHPNSAGGELIEQVRQSLGGGGTVEHLRQYLTSRARESLITLYRSSALLGVIAVRHEENRIRGVPALRFDYEHYPLAQEICSRMQELMFRGEAQLDLQELYHGLATDDPGVYHALVIHGLAYAIRGHWQATQTFCRMALYVADELCAGEGDPLRPMPTGREAGYLLAVSQRRLAKTAADLHRAAEYLDNTIQRAALDARDDPRFRSEAIAQTVSLMIHRQVNAEGNSRGSFAASVALEREMAIAQDILRTLVQEPVPEIVAWVTRQVFTNISSLALMAEIDRPGSTVGLVPALMGLLAPFRAAGLAPDSSNHLRDDLSDFLYWAVLAVFGQPEATARDALKEVMKVRPTDFDHDCARIAAFRQLCSERSRS